MLSPYRVLDLTDERGLLCGQILADLGAEVIAVEPLEGSAARRLGPFAGDTADRERSLWWWAYSRDKRSVALDLKTPGGSAAFRRLAAGADILIESSGPGVMDALGLGHSALAAANPALIYVSISAFGGTGPKADWAATDITVWAAAGPMALIGDDDRPPLRLSVPQSWAHAAAAAAVGALVALHERADSGLGQQVDVSAQQAAAQATMSQILAVAWGVPPFGRGTPQRTQVRMQSLFKAADGYVVIGPLFGAQAAPRTRRLMDAAWREGFCDEGTRDMEWAGFLAEIFSGARPESDLQKVQEAIEGFTAAHSKEELFALARAEGLWLAPVRTTAEVAGSDQLAAREYWQAICPAPGGTHQAPGPFVRHPGRRAAAPARVPGIGQHTAELVAGPARRPAVPATPPRTGRLPLEGVKILDFTWVMAGPAAVRLLVDWGATVIHVESTKRLDLARTSMLFKDGVTGPDTSGWWHNLAMGKLSLTLNPAAPGGHEAVLDLVRWADVVTESFSPKAMQNWGLGYESLRAVNPAIIMLSSCLMGQTGPHSSYAALGNQASPLMGFADVTGWPDRYPTPPTGAYTDLVAPWFTAAALLAALDHRRRTGEGTYIDFAQGEAALHFIAPAVLDYTVNGHIWTRMGNDDLEMAPHGAYPAAGENRWVAIACRDDGDWQRLCAVLSREELAADPRFATASARRKRRRELDEMLSAWTRGRHELAVQEALQAAGVPAHRVQGSSECLADPQLIHREHFVTVQQSTLGPITVEGARFHLSRTRPAVDRPGPMLGEHNDHVLREILGYNDDRIADLIAGGALE